MSIVTLKRKSAARTNKSSAISRGLHNQSASMRLSNIRNKQCTSECNVNWVKDYSPENNSQSAYIKYVKGYESSWGGDSTGSNGYRKIVCPLPLPCTNFLVMQLIDVIRYNNPNKSSICNFSFFFTKLYLNR